MCRARRMTGKEFDEMTQKKLGRRHKALLRVLPSVGGRGTLPDITEAYIRQEYSSEEQAKRARGSEGWKRELNSTRDALSHLKNDWQLVTNEGNERGVWSIVTGEVVQGGADAAPANANVQKPASRLEKVLDALLQLGGTGRLREIVDSYVVNECSPTEQAELEENEEALGRVYDNTATALTRLKKTGQVVSEGNGRWRLADTAAPAAIGQGEKRRAPVVGGTDGVPRGWRQRRVLAAVVGLGRAALQAVVARYVANLTPAERVDFELDPSGWELEYDGVAAALTNLKKAGYVANPGGMWSAEVALPSAVLRTMAPKVKVELDAKVLLDVAILDLGIDFARLIAATAVWAPFPQKLTAEYVCRRAQIPKGEKPGMRVMEVHPIMGVLQEVRLDNNSYANVALKKSIGRAPGLVGFETCHIWPKTCYDVRYHTLVPNLVLLPRAIAGLTDHDKHVEACLKYRAFERFGWYPGREAEDPAKTPASPPPKPEGYPGNWRE